MASTITLLSAVGVSITGATSVGEFPNYNRMTMYVVATGGTGTIVTLQGSPDNGTTWAPLKIPGTATVCALTLSTTVAAQITTEDRCTAVRAVSDGTGNSTGITATLVNRR